MQSIPYIWLFWQQMISEKEFNIHKMLIIKELFFKFCSHYHHDRVIFLVKQKSLNKIQNDIDLFSKLRKIHK